MGGHDREVIVWINGPAPMHITGLQSRLYRGTYFVLHFEHCNCCTRCEILDFNYLICLISYVNSSCFFETSFKKSCRLIYVFVHNYTFQIFIFLSLDLQASYSKCWFTHSILLFTRIDSNFKSCFSSPII